MSFRNLFYITLITLFSHNVYAAMDLVALEKEILQAVNKERADKKLGPLVFENKLLTIAREHSVNMATANILAHELKGSTLDTRVDKIGYNYTQIAENVAMIDKNTKTNIAITVVKMWMNSTGHRENILTPGHKEAGVGLSQAANGDMYFTMVFGAR